MIYLDNAATSGRKPNEVINAVVSGLRHYSSNAGRGGHKASIKAATAIYGVRSKISDYFGSDNENSVCFTSGCTASINTVLNGVLEKGDHIIVSSLEHNAVMRPLSFLAEKRGIQYDIAKIDISAPESSVSSFEKLIKPNTKMIFTTHASNVTGTVLPIEKISKLCKANDLLFGVDAAQSAGHKKIDMSAMNIDYLCAPAHKGLYGPMGVGILIAKKPIDNVIIMGGTGVNSISMEQPEALPERIESGTLNIPGILGTGAAIDFVNKREVKERIGHQKKLMLHLWKALKNIGAILYCEYEAQKLCAPVLSFNISGHSSEETADYLARNNVAVRGGLHCAPKAHETIGTLDNGTVRISTSVFNSYEEIEKTVYLLKKFKI